MAGGAVSADEKKKLFAAAYMGKAKGNGTAAAKLAGYTGSDASLAVTASRLLKDAKVQAIIAGKNKAVSTAAFADVDRCRVLLTRIAESRKAKDADKVQAIDKLLKTQGAYIEKRELTHKTAQVVRVVMPDNGRGPKPTT
jgi:phage terminase small subunit